jgi:cytochrome P450
MTTETATDLPRYPLRRACPLHPPPELERMRRDDPVTRVELYNGKVVWLVTRYDDIRAVLGDQRFSSSPLHAGYPGVTPTGPGNFTHFVMMDNPEHDRYRRMLTRDFTVKRMQALRPVIEGMVDDLLDQIEAHGPEIDLVASFADLLPSLVISRLLGVPYEDHDFFQGITGVLVGQHTTVEQLAEAEAKIRAYLADVLADKQRAPDDSLFSRLQHEYVATGELSQEDAVSMALVLLNGGHETSVNMIALGVVALLENPEQLAALRASPELMPGAVEELLRFLTIAHTGRRRVATADVEIGGQLIRAGEGVITSDPSGNRDAGTFPDADALDVHRRAQNHLAFGFGVHQCLGQNLARVELQVAYAKLFARFPTLRLAVPIEQLPFKNDAANYGLNALPVTW